MVHSTIFWMEINDDDFERFEATNISEEAVQLIAHFTHGKKYGILNYGIHFAISQLLKRQDSDVFWRRLDKYFNIIISSKVKLDKTNQGMLDTVNTNIEWKKDMITAWKNN